MTVSVIRKEIQELRNYILYKYEPACKLLFSEQRTALPRKRLKPTEKLIHTHMLSSSIRETTVQVVWNKIFTKCIMIRKSRWLSLHFVATVNRTVPYFRLFCPALISSDWGYIRGQLYYCCFILYFYTFLFCYVYSFRLLTKKAKWYLDISIFWYLEILKSLNSEILKSWNPEISNLYLQNWGFLEFF